MTTRARVPNQINHTRFLWDELYFLSNKKVESPLRLELTRCILVKMNDRLKNISYEELYKT